MRTLGLSACVACVALSACSFSGPGDATIDGSPGGEMTITGDAPDEPSDARQCFGTDLGTLCLSSAPTEPLVLNGMIDTGIDASCREVIAVGGTMSCVLTGTTVTLASGNTYRGIGSRPLVIVASGVMTIDGTLTVGSPRGGQPGAGASTAPCTAPGASQNDLGGGGGGAGGSFTGPGGDGGNGDDNESDGMDGEGDGGVHAAAFTLTTLRAGCGGGSGGRGSGGNNDIGPGGAGGGALYLIAGTELRIAGSVSAFGAGGTGGDNVSGAGGGGSGGMIGLDAPMVNVGATGSVTANGGGGGEGGGRDGGRCDSGDNGTTTASGAAGGVAASSDGSTFDGGNGGVGSAGGTTNGVSGTKDDGGGGGGGGGAGIIYVRGALIATGATISPAASTN